MQTPSVSFVVPCYNLAHVLRECIGSILAQTYDDFEVLIMDDCSQDNTAEIANSFQDRRIKHIRNDHNLGNIRNFNKGISMSRGKYVWLISADDYLRRPYILQRYVGVMEKYPQVGYSLCPGVVARNGQESEVVGYSIYSKQDQIVNGRTFLTKLVKSNMVVAASALVRRQCYEKISLFPLHVVWSGQQVEMRWVGDWYLWCLFALYHDVAYFAEPMVCYRDHDLSMTSTLTRESIQIQQQNAAADIVVPWVIRQKAKDCGLRRLSKGCLLAAARQYARHAASISIGQCEESLCRNTESEKERNWVRARMFAGMGDISYWRGDLGSARKLYLDGLQKDPRMAPVYAKLLLLSLGKPGDYVRRVLRSHRGNQLIVSL